MQSTLSASSNQPSSHQQQPDSTPHVAAVKYSQCASISVWAPACNRWSNNGTCHLGIGCKYKHEGFDIKKTPRCTTCGSKDHKTHECILPGGGKDSNRDAVWLAYKEIRDREYPKFKSNKLDQKHAANKAKGDGQVQTSGGRGKGDGKAQGKPKAEAKGGAKVVEEYKEIIKLIAKLKGILDSRSQRMSIIKHELEAVREQFGDDRRTEIMPYGADVSMEDIIAEEDMVLTITHSGYIKRTPLTTYRTQRRGGRGIQGALSKETDFVEHLFIANTHNYILFFTDRGKCYWLKVYDIIQGGRATLGRAIVNLIGCEPGEKIEAFVSVKNFDENHYIVMCTQNGIVKKTVLSAYSKPRKGGIYAIDIRDGDRLIEAKTTDGDNDILLGTREGKSIRFSEQDVRSTGRKTMGVKGITLSTKDDAVIGMLVVKREGTILVGTEKGLGKRTDVLQYRTQKRGGKGVMTMRINKKTGKMTSIMEAVDTDDLVIITDQGVLMRQPVSAIRTIGRVTQGVKLVKLDEGAKISSIIRVIHEEDEVDKNDQKEEISTEKQTKPTSENES